MIEHSRERWKSSLLKDRHVNLSLLSRSLSVAMASEIQIVTAEQITKLVLRQLPSKDFCSVVIQDGQVYLGVPAMYNCYAECVGALGRLVQRDWCVQSISDECSMPRMGRTQAILLGLSDLIHEFMALADKVQQKAGGDAQESLRQLEIRTLHKVVGLKVVKP
ncbi:MAG: hypothetical protein RSD49_08045 [Hafnia sp.]